MEKPKLLIQMLDTWRSQNFLFKCWTHGEAKTSYSNVGHMEKPKLLIQMLDTWRSQNFLFGCLKKMHKSFSSIVSSTSSLTHSAIKKRIGCKALEHLDSSGTKIIELTIVCKLFEGKKRKIQS